MAHRKIIAVLSASAFLLLLALSSVGSSTPDESITDFKLTSLDGKVVETAEACKGKVLVLKFGASWCPYCNPQIEELKKAEKHYRGQKVALVEVAVGEDADQVRKHMKKYGASYTVLLDGDGVVAGKYEVEGIPVVIVADASGKVVYRGYYTKFQQLKKVIDAELAKGK